MDVRAAVMKCKCATQTSQGALAPAGTVRQKLAGKIDRTGDGEMKKHDEVDELVGAAIALDEQVDDSAMVTRGRTTRPTKGKECAMTPNQFAWRYGVGVHKVLGWIKRGELRAINMASDLILQRCFLWRKSRKPR